MTTNTTLSAARSGALEGRGAVCVSGSRSPRTVRPGHSCGTVDSTGVLPPDPTAVSGICTRCIPVASSGPSVNDRATVPAPFACTEPRHSLAQRRNAADEGPLTTEILIANPELEFRLTHRKLSPLKISNRKKIAIFYPVFRRSATAVLSPPFPSGRGFIPSVTDRGNTSVPLVYPEDAPRRRRALIHLRRPSPFFPFWHGAASRRSRSSEFLIANARLEFAVSHSKEGPLKISNRERIAISNRIQPPRPRPAHHSSLMSRHCLPKTARKLTPPQRAPILVLPPKENRHGKPRHTKRRPHPYRKIYGRTLAALRD